jgi:hypothetical protein
MKRKLAFDRRSSEILGVEYSPFPPNNQKYLELDLVACYNKNGTTYLEFNDLDEQSALISENFWVYDLLFLKSSKRISEKHNVRARLYL